MSMMISYRAKIILSCIFFLLPSVMSAAEFRLVPSIESVHAGDEFSVEVSVDTDTETINALEGSVVFNKSLQLQDIRLVGSVVPLWISGPVETEPGRVSFAGVLPGGYQGSGVGLQGNVFTLIFKALQTGDASISFGDESTAYKHDGSGTSVAPTRTPLVFTILPASGSVQKALSVEDVFAPETFVPVVVQGGDFGVAGPVLIFTTQDKNSGLSHYELASAWLPYLPQSWLVWSRAASPYMLSGTERSQFIYLRAIDKAGNTVTVSVDPVDNPLLLWGVQGILIVLILGVLFLFAFFLTRYVRRTKDFT